MIRWIRGPGFADLDLRTWQLQRPLPVALDMSIMVYRSDVSIAILDVVSG